MTTPDAADTALRAADPAGAKAGGRRERPFATFEAESRRLGDGCAARGIPRARRGPNQSAGMEIPEHLYGGQGDDPGVGPDAADSRQGDDPEGVSQGGRDPLHDLRDRGEGLRGPVRHRRQAAVQVQHHGCGRRRKVRDQDRPGERREGPGVRAAVGDRLLLLETPGTQEPVRCDQAGASVARRRPRTRGQADAAAQAGRAASRRSIPTQSLGGRWSRRRLARRLIALETLQPLREEAATCRSWWKTGSYCASLSGSWTMW